MILLNESTTYADGASVYHPVVLLEGTVSKQWVDYIEIYNESTECSINWPVTSQSFRAFVLLHPGANVLKLKHGFYTKTLSHTFTPRQSPYIVQPLYIISSDGSGDYQAPPGVDSSPAAALKRINLGVALLQTFTAVNMKSLDLGVTTFHSSTDATSGFPACSIFKSKYSTDEMYSMTNKELWRNLAREIMDSSAIPNRHTAKFLAFLSCTRYDGRMWTLSWKHRDIIAATKGYAALGGGGLALVGTGTLHTWADCLENLVPCFTNEAVMDCSKLMDDSAYRLTYWANYATGLGAALHELGHTFELPHTAHGIMSRGFDNMHRFFVLENVKAVNQCARQHTEKLKRLKSQLQGMANKRDADDLSRKSNQQGQHTVQQLSLARTIAVSVRVEPFASLTASTVASRSPHTEPHQQSASKSPLPSPCLQLTFGNDHMTHRASPGVTQATPDVGTMPAAMEGETQAASTWATESAIMLRYSRWLMQDGEILENPTGSKPVVTGWTISTPQGLRVIQVHQACLDLVTYSKQYTEDTDCTTVHLADMLLCKGRTTTSKHTDSCDTTSCVSLHIRDAGGNFLKYDANDFLTTTADVTQL